MAEASGSSLPANWAAGADPSYEGEGEPSFVLDTEPAQPPSPKKKRSRRDKGAADGANGAGELPFTIDTHGEQSAIEDSHPPPRDEASASPQTGPGQNTDHDDQPPRSSSPPLLLPEHVQIDQRQARRSGEADAEDAAAAASARSSASPDDLDGDLGDFTQIDGGEASRYYDVAAAEERKALKECETCGELGHTKRDCSHTLCASCGATDEHTTRECPVGISCFRCGQRGHRRNECQADLRGMRGARRDCPRCGSYNHAENSCPTYWRIYAYVDEDEWLDLRTAKAAERSRNGRRNGESSRKRPRREKVDSDDMETGDGSESEGYDELGRRGRRRYTPPPSDWDPAVRWCYNCAARGTHWGDDCPLPRRGHRSGEASVFSEFISGSGPFGARLGPPPRPEPTAPVAPSSDMYDVSVGPNASMHFFGGSGGSRSGSGTNSPRPSIEEEVERIFARAPQSSKRRTERERARERERERRERRQPQVSSSLATATPINSTATNGAGSNKARQTSRRDEFMSSDGESGDGSGPAAKAKQKERKKQNKSQRPGLAEDLPQRPLSSREEQSRRDKAAHARKQEDRKRSLEQKGIQRRGEPIFGRFSTDGDDSYPASEESNSRPSRNLQAAPKNRNSKKKQNASNGGGDGGAKKSKSSFQAPPAGLGGSASKSKGKPSVSIRGVSGSYGGGPHKKKQNANTAASGRSENRPMFRGSYD